MTSKTQTVSATRSTQTEQIGRYSFCYDLNQDMQPGTDELTFWEDGGLTGTDFDGQPYRIETSLLSEVTVLAGVGCAILFVKYKDESEKILCRFTMSGLKPAGEFCKVVNFYIQTGLVRIPAKKEAAVCEKCGRPLPEGLEVCIFCYNRKAVLSRAFQLLKPFFGKLVWSEVVLAISSLLFLSTPLISRYLIDDYLTPKTGKLMDIIFLAGVMLAARGVGELFFILSSRVFNKASIGFANHLRNLAYEKIQQLSLTSLSKRTPGDLIRRIMEDTNTIKDFLSDGGRWAAEQLLLFVLVMAILLMTDVKLTLLVVLPLPLVMFVLSRFWRFINLRYERQWRKNSRCQSILHDIIRGIRTVKSFGNEEREIAKFSGAARELAKVCASNESFWALLFPALTFLTGIGEFLVLYFGGNAIMGGTLTLGILVQFTMYIGFIYAPLRWLVSFPRWLADAMTSMVKVFEILDEDPDIRETETSVKPPLRGEIKFEGVSFGYKSYEPVLKNVDLEIRPGEMIGLVGRSGVGKSTLINLALRLYDPTSGRITINGTDLRDISPGYLHERVGVVFQETFLFAGSIFDNIAYTKTDATIAEVIAAAKAASAHEFIMKTSDGYNTLIGESGYSISGGERQRIAIARAIIKNPEILILDEATSSLDVETESVIQECMGRIIKGRTTIAIAHRLSTLRSADRLIVLDKNGVAEIGTHVELLKQRGIYYNLVMAQRQTASLKGKTESKLEAKQ